MPAKSKSQFRFMQMLAHNPRLAKKSTSMSPEQAKEYVSENKGEKSYSHLPEKKKRVSKTLSKMKGK